MTVKEPVKVIVKANSTKFNIHLYDKIFVIGDLYDRNY